MIQSILHDFYVDDLLKEANTGRKKLEEAITIKGEIDALVWLAGLKLQKWVSSRWNLQLLKVLRGEFIIVAL